MKVALLTDCYLPRLGGIEVQTHDLASHLRERGHQVEVFTATQGERGERDGYIEQVDGIPVHRMALRLPWELPVNPLAPRSVRRRLVEGGFDVAHIHMGVVSPFATDMAGVTLGLGLPTAITWHCLMERSQPMFRLLGHARRWGEQGAALSAVSAVAAEAVSKVVSLRTEVRVFPNGIDVAAWAPPAEASPLQSKHSVRIVAAMRLAARKRPRAVLEVAAGARAMVPSGLSMQLELFGEGPERGRLERYLASHDMADWVSLPGRVSREELRERYWASDLYLTPARLEAFGIAALEARTAGLPVLARSGTGIRDFGADGVHGFLAPDDARHAERLAWLVSDGELRGRMAKQNATEPPPQSWPAVTLLAEYEYRRAGAS